MDQGFVGFDDLDRLRDQGKNGSYDRVMFSGVVKLKVSIIGHGSSDLRFFTVISFGLFQFEDSVNAGSKCY